MRFNSRSGSLIRSLPAIRNMIETRFFGQSRRVSINGMTREIPYSGSMSTSASAAVIDNASKTRVTRLSHVEILEGQPCGSDRVVFQYLDVRFFAVR